MVTEIAENPEVESAIEGASEKISNIAEGAIKVVESKTSQLVNEATNTNLYNKIGSTGNYGQKMLEQLEPNGTPQYRWNDVPGFDTARISDVYNEDTSVAREAKTGYQSLTHSNLTQIAKDKALVNSGKINNVTYDFFQSSVTGKIGPSQPYYKALKTEGFTVNIWHDIKP